MANYREKIAMKFNTYQLDNIIVAILNNAYNKKFVSNINQLFMLFQPNTYTDDFSKETRVYIIKSLTKIILEKNLTEKQAILASVDFDGKYYSEATEILNGLFETEMSEQELGILDNAISNQLKYKTLDENADKIIELMNNFKTENYEDINTMITQIEESVNIVNKELKSARESLEDSKKDMNLSSNGFISVLDDIIQKERNPSAKVKTGLQYLNAMLGGGFEKGQIYKNF